MRKKLAIFLLIFTLGMSLPNKSHAIVWVVVKALAKKVIRAIDLQVQRLQNKTIVLQNAQKELENVMSKLKLKEINEWGEKQRKQYDVYYKELQKVRNLIALFKRVKNIIDRQKALIDEYGKAYEILRSSNGFTGTELVGINTIYQGILNESLTNLEKLKLAINPSSTEMNDASRLKIISEVSNSIDNNLVTLRSFNQRNLKEIFNRNKTGKELSEIRRYYGLQKE